MQKLISYKLFWILQITGWSAYFIFYSLLVSYIRKFDLNNLMLHTLTYILGFTISSLLRYPYRKIYERIEKLYWLPVVIIIGSALATLVWTYIDMYVSHFFWENGAEQLRQRLQPNMLIKYSWLFTILLTSWSALYFGIKYAMDWQTQKERTHEAEMLAQKAQMEMLRYQLNPHFLFNSLNSIRALVDENKTHAKEMITELSEFLRYSLLHKDATFVSLSGELEAVKHYFSIEKKRFEEKLEIEYRIADNTQNMQILSFLMHPIVENAVKYGMQTSVMPLKISISSQKTGMGLMIEVCNSGSWIDADQNKSLGTGTGLSNVENRLKNAYGNNYRFEVLKAETHTCVRIEIKEPYLYG